MIDPHSVAPTLTWIWLALCPCVNVCVGLLGDCRRCSPAAAKLNGMKRKFPNHKQFNLANRCSKQSPSVCVVWKWLQTALPMKKWLFHIKCSAFLLQTDSCLKTTPLVDHFLKSGTINSNNFESFLNPQPDSLGIHNLFFWSVLFFRYFFNLF